MCVCVYIVLTIYLHIHTYTHDLIFLTVIAVTVHCRKFGKHRKCKEESVNPVTHHSEKHCEYFTRFLPAFCGMHTHVIVSCRGPAVQVLAGTCPQALRTQGSLGCQALSQGDPQTAGCAGAHCLFSHSPWAVEATSDLCPWAWHPLLLNQTCLPRSKANLLTLGCGEGKYSIYLQGTKKGEWAANAQKTQTP